MINNKFKILLEAGEREAKIFMLNLPNFVDTVVLRVHDIQEWRVEGSDFIIDKLEWTKKDVDIDAVGFFGEFGTRGNKECLIPQIVHGGVEIKAILPGKLIERNDIGHCLDPAIPLALWDGNKQDDNGRTVYTRDKHGSLRRFFQPEWIPDPGLSKKQFSSQPLMLAYMVECLDYDGYPRPYASIVFPDFQKLKNSLIDYAKDNSLDLNDWDSIPTGNAANDFRRGNLIFNANMWFVPLHVFVKIARITIIGDPPFFFQNGSCSIEMQKKRYEYMCEHATTFVPYEELRLDGDVESIGGNPRLHLLKQDLATIKGELMDANGVIL